MPPRRNALRPAVRGLLGDNYELQTTGYAKQLADRLPARLGWPAVAGGVLADTAWDFTVAPVARTLNALRTGNVPKPGEVTDSDFAMFLLDALGPIAGGGTVAPKIASGRIASPPRRVTPKSHEDWPTMPATPDLAPRPPGRIFYHSTDANFDVFDPTKLRDGEVGHFFSPNPHPDYGDNVMEVSVGGKIFDTTWDKFADDMKKLGLQDNMSGMHLGDRRRAAKALKDAGYHGIYWGKTAIDDGELMVFRGNEDKIRHIRTIKR